MKLAVVAALAAVGMFGATQVMAWPPPPEASFTVSPAQPVAGKPATYISTSSDPDDDLSEVAWDFDNDGDYEVTDTSEPFRTTHTYAGVGAETVGIRATAGRLPGDVTTATQTVVVNAPPSPAPPASRASAMTPFPTVRIIGRLTRRGARIQRLAVKAPAFATVRVRCRGRRLGCPARGSTATIGAATKVVRFKRFERRLRARAVLAISVTRPGVVGKHTTFRIRRGKAPARRDRCLVPGAEGPVHCPES